MRTGKIARLSGDIREQLNQRIENGELGESLLKWLNDLPEVQKTLTAAFEGVPISKQNLSEWRQGGFSEWQIRLELMAHAQDLSASSADMGGVVDTPLLAGDLVTVLAAHYARLLNTWDGEPDPKFEAKLRVLRGLARDIALIQKTAHQADRQKNEFEQKNRDDETREIEQMKKEAVAPIWAKIESRSLAKIIGRGEYGQRAADIIMAVENEVPLSELDAYEPKTCLPSEASSKEEASTKADQTQSNLVKPKPAPLTTPLPPAATPNESH